MVRRPKMTQTLLLLKSVSKGARTSRLRPLWDRGVSEVYKGKSKLKKFLKSTVMSVSGVMRGAL